MDTADLIIETHQDPEVVRKALEQSGRTNVHIDVRRGMQPETEAAPAEETAPPEVEDAALAAEEEVPATAETPETPAPAAAIEQAPPAEKKPSRGYKHKAELALAENSRLKQELEALKKGNPAPAAAAATPAPPAAAPAAEAHPAAIEAKPKPNPEDFENGVYDPAYMEAFTDWRLDERVRVAKENAAKQERDNQVKERHDADERDERDFNEWRTTLIDDSRARHEDFDAVIATDHGKPVTNDVMNEALWSSDRGAELAYWLGTHPEEANKLHERTQFKKGESIVQFRKKLALAISELGKIELPDLADTEEEEEEQVEPAASVAAPKPAASGTPAPKAATPKTPAAKPAAPKSASLAPAPKPAPPRPVGSRGASPTKMLSQMTSEELRALSTDQYRKLKEAEFGRR